MNLVTLLDILKENTFLTVGCTDPVAVGLAAAISYRAIGGEIKKLKITLDKNIYKDAIAVGIPGTMEKGMNLAVALCLLKGDPGNRLSILKDVDHEAIKEAKEFLLSHEISFALNEKASGIFIKSEIQTSNGTASALLVDNHDNLAEVIVNGTVIFSQQDEMGAHKKNGNLAQIRNLSASDILDYVKGANPGDLAFLDSGIKINLSAALEGEKNRVGIGVGTCFREMIKKGLLPDGIINQIKQKVGAAADARMSGMKVPIFGCFGSGNHGIVLFITVGMMGEHLGAEKQTINESLAIALLVTGLVKSRTGILTPHCGCAVAAGTGAAAGITYLLGGKNKEIVFSIQLMLANLTGMLCDGAKYSCSLKMATAAGVVVESAYMAMLGAEVPGDNGIIGSSLEETMDNLEILTEQGMKNVDSSILDILLNKPCIS